MTDLPWLSLLIVVPLLGALVVAVLPSKGGLAKPVALGVSLLTLGIAVAATATSFTRGSDQQFQMVEQHEWIPQFGVSYALGVDGISLALILMALVLTPVCLLAAWNDIPEGGGREKTYYALLLSLVPFMVGVFAATDVFLFYVFFEAMLIPVYFLIGMFGGERRQAAAVKFLLYSLAGGLIMLVGVIALYFQGPGGSEGFLVERLTGLSIDPTTEKWLFVAFFVAFAVKAPMWPVHAWLPDAASASRPAVATLLVGVLDKVGTYGMIRFCLQLFPGASEWATPVVLTLAVVSVLYGAILAIGQTDLMRLVAFTSISHFGFIVIGIFAVTSASQTGSNLYMINHGFSTAALFLVAGMLVARRGTARIDAFGGWQRVTPALAGVFLVAGLSALALPGLSSFVSEFLVIAGTYPTYPVVTVVAALGVILAALYVLLAYKRMMTGPPPVIGGTEGSSVVPGSTDVELRADAAGTSVAGDEPAEDLPYVREDLDEGRRRGRLAAAVPDLSWREKVVVAPLIASFLVLGVYPKPVLDTLTPAVERTLEIVGVSDPAPEVPADSTSTSGGTH
ncbi:NADH-quinone oxidoreductase subunit M [Janibacter alkaliphilus]|uniref:NADH-quinone oxidoreductase subunit M n=1 Tax=Janibacter alkaliphilus TaxID=1069963 RepID=A0A852X1Z2_9MICO|nr:NADH-quinone oxidoreductase subunit M [Janibacter alkaliphilus]NYG37106.1 NADH-quinone oxidoreductase subunit M [Janibacter alkaliphilus]